MFNAKEFIDDLVMDGFEREEAIQMAKDELAKRKTVSITTGLVAKNDYDNKEKAKAKPQLRLNWKHR